MISLRNSSLMRLEGMRSWFSHGTSVECPRVLLTCLKSSLRKGACDPMSSFCKSSQTERLPTSALEREVQSWLAVEGVRERPLQFGWHQTRQCSIGGILISPLRSARLILLLSISTCHVKEMMTFSELHVTRLMLRYSF